MQQQGEHDQQKGQHPGTIPRARVLACCMMN